MEKISALPFVNCACKFPFELDGAHQIDVEGIVARIARELMRQGVSGFASVDLALFWDE